MLFNLQGAYRFAVVFATAYLIYHTFIGLSRTFLKFFNFLFSSSVPTATACISYHITSALSIPFSKLFSSFFQYFTQLHLRLFYILSHNIPFVKNFFILFLISHLFATAFVYYHTMYNLSTVFWKIFSTGCGEKGIIIFTHYGHYPSASHSFSTSPHKG